MKAEADDAEAKRKRSRGIEAVAGGVYGVEGEGESFDSLPDPLGEGDALMHPLYP
jgi:hypothetical protein